MGGDEALIGEVINVYKILVGKPEGKRPIARPVQGVSFEWNHLAQDRDWWWGNEPSG
jgi:hypothetical protein